MVKRFNTEDYPIKCILLQATCQTNADCVQDCGSNFECFDDYNICVVSGLPVYPGKAPIDESKK